MNAQTTTSNPDQYPTFTYEGLIADSQAQLREAFRLAAIEAQQTNPVVAQKFEQQAREAHLAAIRLWRRAQRLAGKQVSARITPDHIW